MLRDSLWSPEREAERRRREAEHRWTQFDHTGHTKFLNYGIIYDSIFIEALL